jgi:hypothetical protein
MITGPPDPIGATRFHPRPAGGPTGRWCAPPRLDLAGDLAIFHDWQTVVVPRNLGRTMWISSVSEGSGCRRICSQIRAICYEAVNPPLCVHFRIHSGPYWFWERTGLLLQDIYQDIYYVNVDVQSQDYDSRIRSNSVDPMNRGLAFMCQQIIQPRIFFGLNSSFGNPLI